MCTISYLFCKHRVSVFIRSMTLNVYVPIHILHYGAYSHDLFITNTCTINSKHRYKCKKGIIDTEEKTNGKFLNK